MSMLKELQITISMKLQKFGKNIFIENLPADLEDIKLLNTALNKYGFELVENERELEFFVLEENGWKEK